MLKITLGVDGMMCGMCESHVNDAVRKAFPQIKKVTSSHGKGETVIMSDSELDKDALKSAIDATGYTAGAIESAPCEEKKRGLFGFLHR